MADETMGESSPPTPPMELVLVADDVLCTFCKRHIGPFMVRTDPPGGPSIYTCQLCARQFIDAFDQHEQGGNNG